MSSVKEHYNNHLGHFYSWMLGDFEARRQEQEDFFIRHHVLPAETNLAVDLGSGNGIQSIALGRLDFSVKAIDFNRTLCDELRTRKLDLDIEVIEFDIGNLRDLILRHVDLVVCMGDTLTHLPDQKAVQTLIKEIGSVLAPEGRLILCFRDLSTELTDEQRFFVVRADDTRIHTCFLEYFPLQVMVTDILHEKTDSKWSMKASAYPKLRLPAESINTYLSENNFDLVHQALERGMHTFIAQKMK